MKTSNKMKKMFLGRPLAQRCSKLTVKGSGVDRLTAGRLLRDQRAADVFLLSLYSSVPRVEEDDEAAGEETEQAGLHQHGHWGRETQTEGPHRSAKGKITAGMLLESLWFLSFSDQMNRGDAGAAWGLPCRRVTYPSSPRPRCHRWTEEPQWCAWSKPAGGGCRERPESVWEGEGEGKIFTTPDSQLC